MTKADKPEERKPTSATKHARTVIRWGFGPPDLHRVETTLQLGRRWRWTLRDFALREIRRGEGETLRLRESDPLFWGELSAR